MSAALGVSTLSADAFAITSADEWDAAFHALYPAERPLLDRTDGNDDHQFAWQGHFWLRGYLAMAQTTGDFKYLDWAVELIDHMWAYSDPERIARGEITHNGYVKAPVYTLYGPGADTNGPSWRFPEGGDWRIEALTDGMILQGMTRFVYLVQRDARFAPYRSIADDYLPRIEEVIAIHDENYSFDRETSNPGSYYYTAQRASTSYADDYNDRIWGSGKPYNHNACFAVSLLLLDDLYGRPDYLEKARGILQYWKDNHFDDGSAYSWKYDLLDDDGGIEDIGHGALDMDFLVLSQKFGVTGIDDNQPLSSTDLDRLVGTVEKFQAGGGQVTDLINGTNSNAPNDDFALGYGWLELATYDSDVLTMAEATYNANYENPTWSRPFLGWANFMRVRSLCQAPGPEACDGVDNDCDGFIDEGIGCRAGSAPETPGTGVIPGAGTGGSAPGGSGTDPGTGAGAGSSADGSSADTGATDGGDSNGAGSPGATAGGDEGRGAAGDSGGCSVSPSPSSPRGGFLGVLACAAVGLLRRRRSGAG